MKYTHPHLHPHKAERGSALIIILIAVALFGALSFAVSSMMRDGNTTGMTSETLKIGAADVTDYARTLRQAVQNVRISNACEDTEINFDNNFLTLYTNGGAPGDESCDIFSIAGGAVNYSEPADDWLDLDESASTLYGEWYFTGYYEVDDIGNDGTTDLIAFLPWIHPSLCAQINSGLGISGDTTESFAFDTGQKFTGTYGSGNVIGAAAAGLVGKSTGCMTDSNSASFFFMVLLPR